MKSTPKAARKLLHLFAYGLIITVLAGSFVYLRSVFYQEVSLRRSVMNEAVFNAKEFFVSRQTLLKSLVLAAVPDKTGHDSFISVAPEEEMNISLGSEAGHWSIGLHLLIRRMDSRLITPGEQHIQALIESEAFNRAVLQVAPIALCVIRQRLQVRVF